MPMYRFWDYIVGKHHKTNMATNESMIQTLSSLLVEEEVLQTPFYAIVEEKGRQKNNGFCFIGTTESVLLFAFLNSRATEVMRTARIPLKEIDNIEMKKTSFMNQVLIKIVLYNDACIQISASTKALKGDFVNQEMHLLCFIERLYTFNEAE